MRKHAQRRGRRSFIRIGRLTWIGIIVAVLALGAIAAVSLRTSQAKVSAPMQSNNARGNAGLRFGAQQIPLDPQTGQVRPLTQEEAQRMADGIKQLVNQSTDGLQPVRHANGSVSIDLQGRFQNLAVIKRNGDGTLTESCIDNPKAAAVFFGIDPQLVGVPADSNSHKLDSPAPVKGSDQ